MKICVTGASGFIGGRLANHLQSQGHNVIALLRDENATLDLDPAIERRKGDIRDIDSLNRAFLGCDVVMHLAALFNHPELTLDDYKAVNIKGTENVLRTAKELGVGRVVHCSTVGVASGGQPPYAENAPYAPPEWDKYETTKCEGEKAAIKFHKETSYPVMIIRPAQVYGPGDLGKIKFYRMVKKGTIVSQGNTLKHLIYIDDLCRAFELAASCKKGFGIPTIIAAPQPTPLKELVAIVAKAIGVERPKIIIPATPVVILAGAVEFVFNAINKKPPIFRRSMNFFTKSVAFTTGNAKEFLGFESLVSTEDGVKATAQWYQDNGHI